MRDRRGRARVAVHGDVLGKIHTTSPAPVVNLSETGAGPRYYQGKWDGQKMTGTVSVDPGGKTTVGTFELAPG